jgi:hypothetical protein
LLYFSRFVFHSALARPRARDSHHKSRRYLVAAEAVAVDAESAEVCIYAISPVQCTILIGPKSYSIPVNMLKIASHYDFRWRVPGGARTPQWPRLERSPPG